jgi:hypothetical protein
MWRMVPPWGGMAKPLCTVMAERDRREAAAPVVAYNATLWPRRVSCRAM